MGQQLYSYGPIWLEINIMKLGWKQYINTPPYKFHLILHNKDIN